MNSKKSGKLSLSLKIQMSLIQIEYPFRGNMSELYSADKSNRQGGLRSTKNLFQRLHKGGFAVDFDKEIQKVIADHQMRILDPEEEEAVLGGPHWSNLLCGRGCLPRKV